MTESDELLYDRTFISIVSEGVAFQIAEPSENQYVQISKRKELATKAGCTEVNGPIKIFSHTDCSGHTRI